MKRAWAAALLAASWLPGLGFYQPPRLWLWAALILVASMLLSRVPVPWPSRRTSLAALALLLPALWQMPCPYKAIPALLAGALLVHLAPAVRTWPAAWARGAAAASLILLAQSMALGAYEMATSRCHELPRPLAELTALTVRLLGSDVAVDGGCLAIRDVQETQRLAATWELLFDPASVCFLAGGMVLIALFATSDRPGARRRRWLTGTAILLAAVAGWALTRVAVLVSLALHRSLRADPLAFPNVGSVLVTDWVHIVLLAGLLILVLRLIDLPVVDRDVSSEPPADGKTRRRPLLSTTLWAGGAAALAVSLFWVPVGAPRAGRVMVVEKHSTWEPTTEPYGTEVYGEAGSYNYAAVYAWCRQYFEMSRLLPSESIDDSTLRRCDVLVVKTPTERFAVDEVQAIVRFVREGGSLLLIGDHTNVFNMNTYLNDIARHFGFTFRNDLLFRVGEPYKQPYAPGRPAHPAVQHVPPMQFAVSCSIDPGASPGRMVIRSRGLWSLPPAYQEVNYHPQAEYRPRSQYGAWCQLWSTGYGGGRVLAFADSTLFSNFCVFQPGKAELLRGLLDFSNHHSWLDRPWASVLFALAGTLAALALAGAGLWLDHGAGWIASLAIGLCGWSVALLVVEAVHRQTLPVPQRERTQTLVVIDRTVSEVPLFTGAFADDDEGYGYGMLEQWIPRLGVSLARRSGQEVFDGDALVVICPTASVSDAYQRRLVEFVASGGQLLVFDSPDVDGSTANSLLWPFGLASLHNAQPVDEGQLRCEFTAPEVPLQASCEITGGEAVAWLGEMPVAARVDYGRGTVTAIGCGGLFNDAGMGFHWLPEPEAEVRDRYEVLYGFLRAALPPPPWLPDKVSAENSPNPSIEPP